jgi:hypothetical protein
MITFNELDDIAGRADRATPGPWMDEDEIPTRSFWQEGVVEHEGQWPWPWGSEADAVFAYRARTDVPALVAEVRRLRDEVAALKVLAPYRLEA